MRSWLEQQIRQYAVDTDFKHISGEYRLDDEEM
jgi:hypothetical protein